MITPIQPLPAAELQEPVDTNPFVDPNIEALFQMRTQGHQIQEQNEKRQLKALEKADELSSGLQGMTHLTQEVKERVDGLIEGTRDNILSMVEEGNIDPIQLQLSMRELQNTLKEDPDYMKAMAEEASISKFRERSEDGEFDSHLEREFISRKHSEDRTDFISSSDVSLRVLGKWDEADFIKDVKTVFAPEEHEKKINIDGQAVSFTKRVYPEHKNIRKKFQQEFSRENVRGILFNRNVLDKELYDDYLNNPDNEDIAGRWTEHFNTQIESYIKDSYYDAKAEIDQEFLKDTGEVRYQTILKDSDSYRAASTARAASSSPNLDNLQESMYSPANKVSSQHPILSLDTGSLLKSYNEFEEDQLSGVAAITEDLRGFSKVLVKDNKIVARDGTEITKDIVGDSSFSSLEYNWAYDADIAPSEDVKAEAIYVRTSELNGIIYEGSEIRDRSNDVAALLKERTDILDHVARQKSRHISQFKQVLQSLGLGTEDIFTEEVLKEYGEVLKELNKYTGKLEQSVDYTEFTEKYGDEMHPLVSWLTRQAISLRNFVGRIATAGKLSGIDLTSPPWATDPNQGLRNISPGRYMQAAQNFSYIGSLDLSTDESIEELARTIDAWTGKFDVDEFTQYVFASKIVELLEHGVMQPEDGNTWNKVQEHQDRVIQETLGYNAGAWEGSMYALSDDLKDKYEGVIDLGALVGNEFHMYSPGDVYKNKSWEELPREISNPTHVDIRGYGYNAALGMGYFVANVYNEDTPSEVDPILVTNEGITRNIALGFSGITDKNLYKGSLEKLSVALNEDAVQDELRNMTALLNDIQDQLLAKSPGGDAIIPKGLISDGPVIVETTSDGMYNLLSQEDRAAYIPLNSEPLTAPELNEIVLKLRTMQVIAKADEMQATMDHYRSSEALSDVSLIVDLIEEAESDGIYPADDNSNNFWGVLQGTYDEHAPNLRLGNNYRTATQEELRTVASSIVMQNSLHVNSIYESVKGNDKVNVGEYKDEEYEFDFSNRLHLLVASYNLGIRGLNEFASAEDPSEHLSDAQKGELLNYVRRIDSMNEDKKGQILSYLDNTEDYERMAHSWRGVEGKTFKLSQDQATNVNNVLSGEGLSERVGIKGSNTLHPYINSEYEDRFTGLLKSLVDILDENEVDPEEKLIITSLLRDIEHNSGLRGAASDSRHLFGRAMDLRISNKAGRFLREYFGVDGRNRPTRNTNKLEEIRRNHQILSFDFKGNHIHIAFR